MKFSNEFNAAAAQAKKEAGERNRAAAKQATKTDSGPHAEVNKSKSPVTRGYNAPISPFAGVIGEGATGKEKEGDARTKKQTESVKPKATNKGVDTASPTPEKKVIKKIVDTAPPTQEKKTPNSTTEPPGGASRPRTPEKIQTLRAEISSRTALKKVQHELSITEAGKDLKQRLGSLKLQYEEGLAGRLTELETIIASNAQRIAALKKLNLTFSGMGEETSRPNSAPDGLFGVDPDLDKERQDLVEGSGKSSIDYPGSNILSARPEGRRGGDRKQSGRDTLDRSSIVKAEAIKMAQQFNLSDLSTITGGNDMLSRVAAKGKGSADVAPESTAVDASKGDKGGDVVSEIKDGKEKGDASAGGSVSDQQIVSTNESLLRRKAKASPSITKPLDGVDPINRAGQQSEAKGSVDSTISSTTPAERINILKRSNSEPVISTASLDPAASSSAKDKGKNNSAPPPPEAKVDHVISSPAASVNGQKTSRLDSVITSAAPKDKDGGVPGGSSVLPTSTTPKGGKKDDGAPPIQEAKGVGNLTGIPKGTTSNVAPPPPATSLKDIQTIIPFSKISGKVQGMEAPLAVDVPDKRGTARNTGTLARSNSASSGLTATSIDEPIPFPKASAASFTQPDPGELIKATKQKNKAAPGGPPEPNSTPKPKMTEERALEVLKELRSKALKKPSTAAPDGPQADPKTKSSEELAATKIQALTRGFLARKAKDITPGGPPADPKTNDVTQEPATDDKKPGRGQRFLDFLKRILKRSFQSTKKPGEVEPQSQANGGGQGGPGGGYEKSGSKEPEEKKTSTLTKVVLVAVAVLFAPWGALFSALVFGGLVAKNAKENHDNRKKAAENWVRGDSGAKSSTQGQGTGQGQSQGTGKDQVIEAQAKTAEAQRETITTLKETNKQLSGIIADMQKAEAGKMSNVSPTGNGLSPGANTTTRPASPAQDASKTR